MSTKENEMITPQDGDVLKADGSICIFKEERCSVKPSFSSYTLLCNGTIHHNMPVLYTTRRYATEEEKQKLFDKLAEEGLEWKAGTKDLVKLKWKPSVGQHFYYPEYDNGDCAFIIKAFTYAFEDQIKRDKTIAKGWCFKTSKECQEFCNLLNEAINSVKP